LKRIEVIADDEHEIVEAVRRMSANYDMVVTSGGIGPTHDDLVLPQDAEKAFTYVRHIPVLPKPLVNNWCIMKKH